MRIRMGAMGFQVVYLASQILWGGGRFFKGLRYERCGIYARIHCEFTDYSWEGTESRDRRADVARVIFTFELYYSLHAGPSRLGCCPRVSPMSRSHPARHAELLMRSEVGTTRSYLLGSVLLSRNHSVNPKRSRGTIWRSERQSYHEGQRLDHIPFPPDVHHRDTSPESLFQLY